MGYLNPNSEPECSAVFSYRVNPHTHHTKTMVAMDSMDFPCHVRGEHEIHESRRDIPKIGKCVFISWGRGKPRIVETVVEGATE